LIIYDPRNANSGRRLRSHSLTGNVDFAPTILALAGVAAPGGLDGRNLMEIYDDPNTAIHEALPLINVWGPQPVHSLSVVTKDMKFIYWGYAADGMTPTEELYDTTKDPLELVNLAKDSKFHAALTSMQARYDAEVEKWRHEAVDYNDYQRFAVFFDRDATWEQKLKAQELAKKRK
jgi:arylsulfatase A-like enzyme